MSKFNERREAALTKVVVKPIMVDRDTAAAMLMGIAPSTFQRYIQAGTLPPPRQLGNRAGWLVCELEAAAAALPISTLLPPPSKPGG